MITGPGQDGTYTRRAYSSRCSLSPLGRGAISENLRSDFSRVGPGCDLVRRAHGCWRDLDLHGYVDLLFRALEVGFRLSRPGCDLLAIRFNHTSHHGQMFKVAFSSEDDEVIADAVCVWIMDGDRTLLGSLAHYFARRVEQSKPFSPRLRQMGTRAIYRIWYCGLPVSTLETIRLLNRLEVDVDDVEEERGWIKLLVEVICSPTRFKSLSSHNWRLLGKLTSTRGLLGAHVVRDVEVMRSLEEAGDWEKLEVWMVVVWVSLRPSSIPTSESMEGIKKVTLELSLRQRSALQRFENLCEGYTLQREYREKLQEICGRARAERLPSEHSSPLYVSVPPIQHLFILMLPFFLFSQMIHAQPLTPLSFWGDDTF